MGQDPNTGPFATKGSEPFKPIACRYISGSSSSRDLCPTVLSLRSLNRSPADDSRLSHPGDWIHRSDQSSPGGPGRGLFRLSVYWPTLTGFQITKPIRKRVNQMHTPTLLFPGACICTTVVTVFFVKGLEDSSFVSNITSYGFSIICASIRQVQYR